MSVLVQTSFANETTPYFALANASGGGSVSNWSDFPAVSPIDAAGNIIKNISSLQIDAQVLTANASELFLNGVPVATIPDISNVSDWSLYPALANIDANNFAISNVSGLELDGNQVSTLGNTILINGFNPVSNWSAYQANHNVDIAGYNIFNTPSISISGNTQNVVLTACGTSLLVDGAPVFTGALPPSDVSNWANYPAVANVNVSGFNVTNVSDLNVLNIFTPTITMCSSITTTSSIALTATDTQLLVNGQAVYTGLIPASDTSNWANFPAVANVNMSGKNILGFGNLGIIADDISLTPAGSCNIYLNGNTKAKNIDITQGHINQSNVVGDGTTNTLAAATTFGDSAGLGYAEVKGANRVAGFSSFFVEGGVTFDGGTLHGFRATSATIPIPIFGFGSARFELTPLLTAMVSVGPAYIASGTFTAIQALLNARLEAGTFVTITHGNLGGFDGIYLQNTLNNGSNTRIILTAGGTIYNIGNTQTSNLFTPQPIQFWSNVYNPSGGSTPVPPSVGIYPKNPIVYNDVNRNNNLLGNYVGWFGAEGAYEASPLTTYTSLSTFSGTTLIGNFPSVQNTTGITPYNYGSSSVHIGQQTISANFTSPPPTLGDRAVAIGTISGWTGTGTVDNIIIGTHINGITGQGAECVSIGLDTGAVSQGARSIAIGTEAGSNSQGSNSVAIGFTAGSTSQEAGGVAIGNEAAFAGQRANAVAVGTYAGRTTQGSNGVAIGFEAGSNTQGNNSIAIGWEAGQDTQGENAVAIGYDAGLSIQGVGSIAIGASAGTTTQQPYAVAMGFNAGNETQGTGAVAIGFNAASSLQGGNSVAIGNGAGNLDLGSNSIAIGDQASVNGGSFSNTIVLNATGSALNPSQANAFYIKPVRSVASSAGFNVVAHSASTGELIETLTSSLSMDSTISNTQRILYDTGLLTTTIDGILQVNGNLEVSQTANLDSGLNVLGLTTLSSLVIQNISAGLSAKSVYYNPSLGVLTQADAPTAIVTSPAFVYYVSTNGRVGGSGSITDPLFTINEALTKPASTAPDKPGMTIYVAPGEYSEDVVITLTLTLPAVAIIGMADDTDDSKRVQIRGSVSASASFVGAINSVNVVMLNSLAVFAKDATTSAVSITGAGFRTYLKNGLYTTPHVATAPLISLSSTGATSNTVNQLVIDNASMSIGAATATANIINVALTAQIFQILFSDLTNLGTGLCINMTAGAFTEATQSRFNARTAVLNIVCSAASLTSLTQCLVSGRASTTAALITLGTNANLNINDCTVQNLNTTEANNTSRYIYTTSATGNLIAAIRNNITNSASSATVQQITPFQAAVPAASQLLYFGNIYTNSTATLVGVLPQQGGANFNAVRQFNTDTYTQQIQVVATSASAIVLTPTARGKTFILTGTTTQAFSTTGFGLADAAFFVIVHNGNAAGGGGSDITMTGMTGTTIVRGATGSHNGGDVYLYWSGTSLIGY